MNNLLEVFLKFKPDMSGLNRFTSGLKVRLQQVKKFNAEISNGDAELRKWASRAAAFFSGAALYSYAQRSREAETAQKAFGMVLERNGHRAESSNLIQLGRDLERVTNFSKEDVWALEAQESAFKFTSDQIKDATEVLLDYATVARKGGTEAANDFIGALTGQEEVLKRYGIVLDKTKDRFTAVLEAFKSRFGGAARAAVVSPDEQALLRDYQDTMEDLGKSVRYATVPALTVLVDLLKDITGVVNSAAKGFRYFSEECGWLVKGATAAVASLGFLGIAFTSIKAVVNPLRTAVKLFTGQSIAHWASVSWKGITKLVQGSKIASVALKGLGVAAAIVVGWQLGTAIGKWASDIKLFGVKIADWVASSIAIWFAWGVQVKGAVKKGWAWIVYEFKTAIPRIKTLFAEFMVWLGNKFNGTWAGKKLGIEIDTSSWQASLDAAKKQISDAAAELEGKFAQINKETAGKVSIYREVAYKAITEGIQPKDGAAEEAPAVATPEAPAAPEQENRDWTTEETKRRRLLFELETQMQAAEAAHDQKKADDLQLQINRMQYQQDLGQDANDLIEARLKLEGEELARTRAINDNAKSRTLLENTLTRLQNERQIAEQRGDRAASNKLLAQERQVIQQLIDKYEELAQIAETEADKSDALSQIAQLKQQLATLEVPDTFLGSLKRGLGDWMSQVKSGFESLANLISTSIGTAVNGVADGIDGWITGSKSFGSAMLSAWNSIRKAAIQTVVEWLAKQAMAEGLSVVYHAASKAKMFAVDVAFAAKGLALQAAQAAKSLIMWLPSAIAAAISSYGVAAALGVAAVIAAVAAMGGFSKGGDTGDGPPGEVAGVVHRQEWVAPKWMTKHSTYGPMIRNLESVRRRGFAVGGYTDPAMGIAQLTQASSTGSASNTSSSSGSGSSEGAAVNVAVLSGRRQAEDFVSSRRGRSMIIDADRQRRTTRRT